MEQETKVCKCCGRELPISSFKKGRWGYVSVCMDCDKQHRAEKRQARIDEQKQKVEDVRAENRQLCLADFAPRELIERLRDLGYTGKLTYVETHVIDLENL